MNAVWKQVNKLMICCRMKLISCGNGELHIQILFCNYKVHKFWQANFSQVKLLFQHTGIKIFRVFNQTLSTNIANMYQKNLLKVKTIQLGMLHALQSQILRKPRQQDSKFQDSLFYIARPCLRKGTETPDHPEVFA